MKQSLSVWCLCLVSALRAFDQPVDKISSIQCDSICSQILEQEPEAVFFMTEEKLYLKPEGVYPSHQGVLLVNGSSVLEIPMVFADSHGCFIPFANKSQKNQKNSDYWYCTNCGKVFHSPRPPSSCPKCGSSIGIYPCNR